MPLLVVHRYQKIYKEKMMFKLQNDCINEIKLISVITRGERTVMFEKIHIDLLIL